MEKTIYKSKEFLENIEMMVSNINRDKVIMGKMNLIEVG